MKAFKIAAIACALATGASSVALAQSAPIVIGEAPAGNVLPEGTEVPLRTLTELSSKSSKVGDRFNLEVVEDVRLNNQIVIPAGSRAAGEITKVTKKGMFGKSGKLETRLLYVRVGDQQVRITGAVGDRGKGGTAATVGALVMIWPAAFFITGTSAVLAPGTGAVGTLESDVTIAFAPSASRTLVVPAQPAGEAVAVGQQ